MRIFVSVSLSDWIASGSDYRIVHAQDSLSANDSTTLVA